MKDIDEINDAQSDRIDRYLRGEMTASERAEFEASLVADPVLREDFEERRDVVRGIRDVSRAAFREKVERELTVLEQSGFERNRQTWFFATLFFVTGITAGLLLGYLYFKPVEPPPSPNEKVVEPSQPELVVFYGASGERFVFRMTENDSIFEPKIELYDATGKLIKVFSRNDTLPVQIKRQRKLIPSEAGSPKNPNKPVAKNDKPVLTLEHNSATPQNIPLADMLPVRRVLVLDGQKSGEDQLPSIQLMVYTDTVTQYAFFVDKIRLFIPDSFAEGQSAEIVELQGAGSFDGYYLKMGNRVYHLKNTRGNPSDLEPLDNDTILRFLHKQ
jgi:hypothetical protein